MTSRAQTSPYYIGWDVGGWNCDKNGKSRDALVILDADLNIVGQPWRGNLRTTINEAADSADWINRLFALCSTVPPSQSEITLAIDTPLGFSDAFVRLVTQRHHAGEVGRSNTNPYLFRQTERFLFEHGLKPLSAIKDMIGSQATKGMHALARFAPKTLRCGVWSDGGRLTAIEAYPSACKASATIGHLQQRFDKLAHDDLDDALTCALLAYLFASTQDSLVSPDDTVPLSEGWIWVPKDALPRSHKIMEST
jgi:hypothetical protein